MSNGDLNLLSALDGFELWAETYDRWRHPVASMAARHGVRILSPEAGEVILDAGCGTGRDLARIQAAGAKAVGLDFSPAMLRAAAEAAPGADLVEHDLREPLPFEDAYFDAILCGLVADHIDNLTRLMREFLRVLKPAGRLVFTVAHPDFPDVVAGFRKLGVEHYIATYSRSVQDYLDCVADADFEDIAFRAFNGDETLGKQLPTAASHVGNPVLFLIAATVAPAFRYVESPPEGDSTGSI